jgi:hypothetical protein
LLQEEKVRIEEEHDVKASEVKAELAEEVGNV